jgi:hypothetical protein
MADTMQLIASLEWIALGIIVFHRVKRWNKKFEELYGELQEDMERWRSDDG